jgi:short-subunit dehydrogenase
MDESKLMTAEECAALILRAIEKRKRTLIFTVNDKRTVLVNRLMPSIADKLTRKFFFKNGKLVK